MNNIIKETAKFDALCLLACLAAFISGCNKIDEIGGPYHVWERCISFTENSDIENFEYDQPEYIHADASEQTLTLHGTLTNADYPEVNHYVCAFPEPKDTQKEHHWDWDWNEWTSLHADKACFDDYENDYYHVYTEKEDGKPVVKIKLKANDTYSERRFYIHIFSDKSLVSPSAITTLFGIVAVVQAPRSEPAKSFILKSKYKDRLYTTEAAIDDNGEFVYYDSEYKRLMDIVDSNPSIQTVIMDNELTYYYDTEDIAANKPYEDFINLAKNSSGIDNAGTRATTDGFNDMSDIDLGFFSLYDNDHFNDKSKHLSKGLTNFHFTWNLPNLKEYGINDKITSIAVAYNGDEPNVCSVLTVWEDTDYNFGDNDRKRHRISIVASKYNNRTTLPDLKKVKKIGSSKSWNDCISSISFHFGYPDRLLLDY